MEAAGRAPGYPQRCGSARSGAEEDDEGSGGPALLPPPHSLVQSSPDSQPTVNSLSRLLTPTDPAAPARRVVAMPSGVTAWNPARAKIQLRLAIQRVRLLAQKRTQLAKSTRREVAALVEKGKLESAKIKVEGLLSEDLYVELLEVLELCVPSLLLCGAGRRRGGELTLLLSTGTASSSSRALDSSRRSSASTSRSWSSCESGLTRDCRAGRLTRACKRPPPGSFTPHRGASSLPLFLRRLHAAPS